MDGEIINAPEGLGMLLPEKRCHVLTTSVCSKLSDLGL